MSKREASAGPQRGKRKRWPWAEQLLVPEQIGGDREGRSNATEPGQVGVGSLAVKFYQTQGHIKHKIQSNFK